MPDDLMHKEEEIVAELRAGDRVSYFETIRRGKDGREIFVELSVSPVRGPGVGLQELQRLLKTLPNSGNKPGERHSFFGK
jgi:hypothetical protein